MTSTTTYTVTGMTCGHCVASVTEEVQEIPASPEVEVDLATGSAHASPATSTSPRTTWRAAVVRPGTSSA